MQKVVNSNKINGNDCMNHVAKLAGARYTVGKKELLRKISSAHAGVGS